MYAIAIIEFHLTDLTFVLSANLMFISFTILVFIPYLISQVDLMCLVLSFGGFIFGAIHSRKGVFEAVDYKY